MEYVATNFGNPSRATLSPGALSSTGFPYPPSPKSHSQVTTLHVSNLPSSVSHLLSSVSYFLSSTFFLFIRTRQSCLVAQYIRSNFFVPLAGHARSFFLSPIYLFVYTKPRLLNFYPQSTSFHSACPLDPKHQPFGQILPASLVL